MAALLGQVVASQHQSLYIFVLDELQYLLKLPVGEPHLHELEYLDALPVQVAQIAFHIDGLQALIGDQFYAFVAEVGVLDDVENSLFHDLVGDRHLRLIRLVLHVLQAVSYVGLDVLDAHDELPVLPVVGHYFLHAAVPLDGVGAQGRVRFLALVSAVVLLLV